jgi:hypothetical protein
MLVLMGMMSMVAVGSTVLTGDEDDEHLSSQEGDTTEEEQMLPVDGEALLALLDAPLPSEDVAEPTDRGHSSELSGTVDQIGAIDLNGVIGQGEDADTVVPTGHGTAQGAFGGAEPPDETDPAELSGLPEGESHAVGSDKGEISGPSESAETEANPDAREQAHGEAAADQSLQTPTGLQGPLTTEPDDATAWNIQRGGEGDDTIRGSVENDFLLGYGGEDVIRGGEGGDQIEGGEGNDRLFGQWGEDTLHGGDGEDRMRGGRHDDELFGGSGDDTLLGGHGDDTLMGGQGGDSLIGGSGGDALHGYHGDDTLAGGRGEDALFGGLGNDVLFGGGQNGEDDGRQDYLNGADGDDTIHAGAHDVVTGGDGADQILFDTDSASDGAVEVMDFEPGTDSLVLLHDADGEEPEVEIERDSDNPDLYRVIVDGEVAAQLNSTEQVRLEDIALVAQG